MKNVTGVRSSAIGTFSIIAGENYQKLLALESQQQEIEEKLVISGAIDKEKEFESMKLDPVSKWVIIPRLVTGKELPREHRWFELLNKLIKQRNSLVHHKSSSPPVKFDDAIEYYKKVQQNTVLIYDTAREAIELFDLLLGEMKSLDPGEIGWIDSYLAPNSDNPFKLLEEL